MVCIDVSRTVKHNAYRKWSFVVYYSGTSHSEKQATSEKRTKSKNGLKLP